MPASGEDGSEDHTEAPKQTVEVGFTINRPSEDFIPGIRQVLTPLTQTLKLDVFELAELVADQQNVGNIVCLATDEAAAAAEASASEDDEEDEDGSEEVVAPLRRGGDSAVIVGVFTILNLAQHLKTLTPLCEALLKSRNKTVCALLQDREQMKRVGVLLTERVATSMPASICDTIYEECKEDVRWTLGLGPEDELTAEEEAELEYYHFDTLFVVAWGLHAAARSAEASPKRRRSGADDDCLIQALTFPDADIQQLLRKRTAAVAINANATIRTGDGSIMHKYLVVFVVPYAKF